MSATNGAMTKAERDELRRVVNEREKLAKKRIQARRAELLADAEAQLAAVYKFDDEAWADATAAAEGAAKTVNQVIAQEFEERGIPADFAPWLELGWHGRGETAVAARRAELRKVVTTRLDALARKAENEIEAAALDRREALALGALESADARAFMASMPTVDQLMPALNVQELEAVTGRQDGPT